ncbi:hypothetical protein DL98DRAFT_582364 [Cadophora sp. DSE1049]|nr:hypothetical protein DL98DRAFT_582364 [Cadophora sp. DSE1049]
MRRSEILNLLFAVSITAQYTPPTSYPSTICSTVDVPGPPKGIDIAANAISLNTTSLSQSLINGMASNGFTGIGSSQYEYSDQQLFAGLDPNLDSDSYPTGCKNITSCNGVLDVFCQSDLSGVIRSFNNSSSSEAETEIDKCTRFTSYSNAQLQQNDATCIGEGEWIAKFINVIGGSLLTLSSAPSSQSQLGSDDCKPIQPANYQMYKVASMRQLYSADPPPDGDDAKYYGRAFGGQEDWTPVVTVVYEGGGDGEEEFGGEGVRFSCLKTFQPDGEERVIIYESEAGKMAGVSKVALLVVIAWSGVVLWM